MRTMSATLMDFSSWLHPSASTCAFQKNGLDMGFCARSVWLKLLSALVILVTMQEYLGPSKPIHLDLPCSPAKHTRCQLGIRFYFIL